MVLNTGRAKNISSLINRDTGGGIKKQGLPSSVGRITSVQNIVSNRIGCSLECPRLSGVGAFSCSRIGGIRVRRC